MEVSKLIDLASLYLHDADFKDYVDKFARTQRRHVDEVLTWKLTESYANYLKQLREENAYETKDSNVPCEQH